MEHNGVLPTTKFAYWKGLGTCEIPVYVSHTLQSALETVQEARIVQHDFCAAFNMANHQCILYKLHFVSMLGSLLSILTEFLSNKSEHVMVDGCRIKLVNMVSRVPQGSVSRPMLFSMYTSQPCSILEISLSVMRMTPL